MHIENLYKNNTIMMMKECYATEKIHGTSTHISYNHTDKKIHFSSGGESHARFVALFDEAALLKAFQENFSFDVVVFGEGYGGKQQKMSHTYGPDLKFIVFDVKVGDYWLNVPNAEDVAHKLGLEFVHYVRIPTTIEAIDAERDADSVQAVRNGMGSGHPREGVVLRPLIEMKTNDGSRIMSKHKGAKFSETASHREVDPDKLQVLTEANEIAEEWVTPMRLEHVLDKLPQGIGMEKIPDIIKAMIEDVYREGEGELVQSKAVEKAIGKQTVFLFKKRLEDALKNY